MFFSGFCSSNSLLKVLVLFDSVIGVWLSKESAVYWLLWFSCQIKILQNPNVLGGNKSAKLKQVLKMFDFIFCGGKILSCDHLMI